MSTDADVQRQIDDIQPLATDLEADHEQAKRTMQAVVNAISGPLQKHNAAQVRPHLETLNDVMADYAALVTRGKDLAIRVNRLQADDAGGRTAKALAALQQKLDDLRGRMDRNYLSLKDLQNKANEEVERNKSSFAEAWAEMEAYLDTNLKLHTTRLQQIKALHELATGAVAERDAKELAQIQARNQDRTTWKPTAADINSRLIQFFGQRGAEVGPDLQQQLTRDRVKFDKVATQISQLGQQIDTHFKAIEALAIKPIDANKAAVAMDLKGQVPRVKKAVDTHPLIDGLDALAKDLKLKVIGRDLLNKLKKARLI